MLENLFASVINAAAGLDLTAFSLCLGAAVLSGILIAVVFGYQNTYTKSFLVSLSILPSVVCVVIMMVNGNVGAGVAVAGTFSLVRFRSVPGTAREISAIFLTMAAGLATGMGYVGFGLLFTLALCALTLLLEKLGFGGKRSQYQRKTLRITMPEDLDYAGVFQDILDQYTTESKLVSVKTTNMGSMYKLTYNVTLKDLSKEKELIDQLRCRNGNLEISSSVQEMGIAEL